VSTRHTQHTNGTAYIRGTYSEEGASPPAPAAASVCVHLYVQAPSLGRSGALTNICVDVVPPPPIFPSRSTTGRQGNGGLKYEIDQHHRTVPSMLCLGVRVRGPALRGVF